MHMQKRLPIRGTRAPQRDRVRVIRVNMCSPASIACGCACLQHNTIGSSPSITHKNAYAGSPVDSADVVASGTLSTDQVQCTWSAHQGERTCAQLVKRPLPTRNATTNAMSAIEAVPKNNAAIPKDPFHLSGIRCLGNHGVVVIHFMNSTLHCLGISHRPSHTLSCM